ERLIGSIRIDPSRVRRPCHRLGRGSSASDSSILRALLQRDPHAAVVGQGRADLSRGSTKRRHQITGDPRWTPSSLRQDLVFDTHSALAFRAWCGPSSSCFAPGKDNISQMNGSVGAPANSHLASSHAFSWPRSAPWTSHTKTGGK